MTAYLNLLVCLALLHSGVNGACVDTGASQSSCAAAGCDWVVVTNSQCIPPSITDCTVSNCGLGCVHTDAVQGQCTSPSCVLLKSESNCNSAACEWKITPADCAIPDSITCTLANGLCNAGNGKPSCELRTRRVCSVPPADYCFNGGGEGPLCGRDTELGHASGCELVGNECRVNGSLSCEYSEADKDCTNASLQKGCQVSEGIVGCSPVTCNLTGTGSSCDTDSVSAGCEFKGVTGVCSLKSGITCNGDTDGSCDNSSSPLCFDNSSEDETCVPNQSLVCSKSTGGDSCDADSALAGCTWKPEVGSCVEKTQPEGSTQFLKTYSGHVALILIAALLLQI